MLALLQFRCFYKNLWFNIIVIIACIVNLTSAYSMPPWPCSKAGCISIPDFWQIPYMNIRDFLDLWECGNACNCNYDQTMNTEGDCISCNTLKNVHVNHKIPVPSILDSCDMSLMNDQFVCEEGYYFSEDTQICIPCVIQETPRCYQGQYFERCQKQNQLACKSCTNVIPNTTSQKYGDYLMIPSCSSSDTPFHIAGGIANCALYMTPLWDEYQCAIECQNNFIDIGLDGRIPECVPCYERCEVGETCYGGSFKTCQPCDGPLENNKMWIRDTSVYDPPCRSTCAYGFYYNSKQECVPCLQHQKCFNSSEIFFGCLENSPGRCQPSNVICTPGESFLFYEVFSASAECRKCSTPKLGLNFIDSKCTVLSDTVLRNCQNTCPSGFYKIQNCTLVSDSVCKKCTDPRTMMGMILNGSCGGNSDNTFSPCPIGYACDGTRNKYECDWPMTAIDGFCKCPHGTYLVGEKCTVVTCLKGFYPHPVTGKCIPCSDEFPNHTITLDNVWGEAACACEEGYFIERTSQTTIRCWPCGDMTCEEGIQYQTPCPGFLSEEPECICKPPPGVKPLSIGVHPCLLASCEEGLEAVQSVFDVFAANSQPKLWESSFWITSPNDNDMLNVSLARPSLDKITSMAIIKQKTIVYVVNHTSLWLASIGTGERGWIDNKLFIFGNRNMTENVLVDVIVSKDASVELRFWLSFVMLSNVCGDMEGETEPFLCSNFELIQIKKMEESCNGVLIHGTSFCAENLYSIWGSDSIGSGIPYLRIYSLYASINNVLYIIAGSTYAGDIYTYSVEYYDPDVPQYERNHEMLIPFTLGNSHAVSYLTVVEGGINTVFALVDGYLSVIPSTSTIDETKKFGIERLLHQMYGIKLLRLWKGLREGILIAITNRQDNLMYEMDVLNGITLRNYPPTSQLSFLIADFHTIIYMNEKENSIALTLVKTVCLMDHMSYFQNDCTIQPCLLLKNACGSNSLREIGTSSCACAPGYYYTPSTEQCQICKSSFYCSGAQSPQPCPSNSYSDFGSISISQCLCKKGYYKFKQNLCLPCPKGFWCYGEQIPPIKCSTGSSTPIVGAQSPIECQCELRTQGIDCKPCAASDICVLLGQNQLPRASAVFLSVSGQMIYADMTLKEVCLHWGKSIVYALPWSILKDTMKWSWVIVSEPLPSIANDDLLLSNITECMGKQGFEIRESYVYSPLQVMTNVQSAIPCGMNSEWSGDVTVQQCTCVAGYEKTSVLSIACTPCTAGTIRQRRSSGRCVRCQDNNSHAPWLGMDHCLCKEGYYMDHDVQTCMPLILGIEHYDIIASPFVAIPLSLTLGFICLLCTWIASLFYRLA